MGNDGNAATSSNSNDNSTNTSKSGDGSNSTVNRDNDANSNNAHTNPVRGGSSVSNANNRPCVFSHRPHAEERCSACGMTFNSSVDGGTV